MSAESRKVWTVFETKQYNSVRPIFRNLEAFQPMCSAVLEGVWPGNVWVDDVSNPSSGLLLTFLSGGGAAWCFLAGDPHNHGFNVELNRAIFEEKIAGEGVGTFLFTCHPEDWGGQLSLVGHPRQLAPMPRRHYICRDLAYDWRSNIPEGYLIQRMDISMLKQNDIQFPLEVETTLRKWASITGERFQDYGYLAIHEHQIVSWATVDFVSGKKGDLGFETKTEYRRQGLGSTVAGAALEEGIDRRIEIHWTCAEDNIGSQRAAEKLGLERDRDYKMYLFSLDLNIHNAQLAYTKLANGAYKEAIDLYEDLFAKNVDLPNWTYFDTAQACAALGQEEKALKYLRIAAKQGWTAVALTESTEEFQILHDNPEWEVVLERMRNAKE